jgi:hypothetical protein
MTEFWQFVVLVQREMDYSLIDASRKWETDTNLF